MLTEPPQHQISSSFLGSFFAADSPGWRPWLLLFLTVFAIRLAWIGAYRFYAVRIKQTVTSQDQIFESGLIARNLASGRGFSFTALDDGHAIPTAHKPPAYPFFLAAVFRVFGVDNLGAARMLQAVLMSGVVLLVGRLFAQLFTPRVGLWTALLILFNPMLAKADVFIENTALTSFFSSLSFLNFWAFLRTSKIKPLLASGFCMGMTSLTNPTFVPAFAGLIITTGWIYPRPLRMKMMILCGVAGLVISPWVVRNRVTLKHWIPINSNLPFEFWMGNNPDASGGMIMEGSPGLGFPAVSDLGEHLRNLDEVSRYRTLGRWGAQYAVHHPTRFLVLRAKSLFYFWFTSRPWLGHVEQVDYVNVAYAILLAVTSFLGYLAAFRVHRQACVIWGAVFLGFMLVYTLTHADTIDRYRLPLDPYLLGFSAYFLAAKTVVRSE
jgi:4-amino-4-deoxy-L-arabinose transferase-like glycosyltransferase